MDDFFISKEQVNKLSKFIFLKLKINDIAENTIDFNRLPLFISYSDLIDYFYRLGVQISLSDSLSDLNLFAIDKFNNLILEVKKDNDYDITKIFTFKKINGTFSYRSLPKLNLLRFFSENYKLELLLFFILSILNSTFLIFLNILIFYGSKSLGDISSVLLSVSISFIIFSVNVSFNFFLYGKFMKKSINQTVDDILKKVANDRSYLNNEKNWFRETIHNSISLKLKFLHTLNLIWQYFFIFSFSLTILNSLALVLLYFFILMTAMFTLIYFVFKILSYKGNLYYSSTCYLITFFLYVVVIFFSIYFFNYPSYEFYIFLSIITYLFILSTNFIINSLKIKNYDSKSIYLRELEITKISKIELLRLDLFDNNSLNINLTTNRVNLLFIKDWTAKNKVINILLGREVNFKGDIFFDESRIDLIGSNSIKRNILYLENKKKDNKNLDSIERTIISKIDLWKESIVNNLSSLKKRKNKYIIIDLDLVRTSYEINWLKYLLGKYFQEETFLLFTSSYELYKSKW